MNNFSSHRSVRGRGGATPFSTKHTGKASCVHPENANRTSSTNTSSNTGPARPCNLDRRSGCTAYTRGCRSTRACPRQRRPLPPSGYSYVSHQKWARRFSGTPARRRLLLVHASSSSLVDRKNFRAHSNCWTVCSLLFGRPQTGQARVLFCSVYYGSWSRWRLVLSTGASKKLPNA